MYAYFFFIFVFSVQLTVNKNSPWLYSNLASLALKSTALPTVLQPCVLKMVDLKSVSREPVSDGWTQNIVYNKIIKEFMLVVIGKFLWAKPGLFSLILFLFTTQWRLHSKIWLKWKSMDGVLGIWTRGFTMEGTDESIELWRPHTLTRQKLKLKFYCAF